MGEKQGKGKRKTRLIFSFFDVFVVLCRQCSYTTDCVRKFPRIFSGENAGENRASSKTALTTSAIAANPLQFARERERKKGETKERIREKKIYTKQLQKVTLRPFKFKQMAIPEEFVIL